MQKHIAVDLGADSGRVIVGDVGELDEVHRFRNGPVRIGDSIHWNILSIYSEIKKGLSEAFAKYGSRISSIGIDTWGVDFALLDGDGDLVGNPYHYRDIRTKGIQERVFEVVPRKVIYEETGVQFMEINSLFQLFAFSRSKPDLFKAVRHILAIPSLLNYWLTGVIADEYSVATTTQLFNPRTRSWSDRLIEDLGFDAATFGKILMPGERIGTLLPLVAGEVGAPEGVPVVASASHDTASAVAAVPTADDEAYAYISSGTWSLLGIETKEPIINDASLAYNFTNEGAADGGIRFLKNIMGLWILQECKRIWDAEGSKDSYDDLSDQAAASGWREPPIDVDDPRFLRPGTADDTMPQRIREYCEEQGGRVPESKGEVVRSIYDGLAKRYAEVIGQIEEITGNKVQKLYIVGGGSSDRYLCELAAKATGIPVYAGPKEATAIGNIIVQAVSMNEIASFSEGRRIIRDSYKIAEYSP